MTQQAYYPPQGQPQGYPPQAPQQFQQPAPPAQYPGYPPQQQPGYGPPQGYPPAQQAPQQQLVQGTLDDFFNQRSAGSGPGLSWSYKDQSKKPIGYWYAGTVARDVGNGDIQQQTNPQGAAQFFRDGSPKYQMLVPLREVQAADGSHATDFADGEATWYVRGQARDELVRAMREAGCSYTTPKAGDRVVIVLSARRSSGQGFQPANVFQIQYQAAPHNLSVQGQQTAGAPSPAPEVPQAQAPAPPPAPAQQQFQPPAQQQPQMEQPQQQIPAPPVQQMQQQAPVQQMQPPPAPQAPQGVPVPPPGLDPNAAAILGQLTGGQPQQQAS